MGSENILMDNFSFQRLDQACQTHFGNRAKFFENRIQIFLCGPHEHTFFKDRISVFISTLPNFYYRCKIWI